MSQQSAAALSAAPAKMVPSEVALVADMVARGRRAMQALKGASQARVDEAVTALAWSVYREDRARELAVLAVEDTGLGNVPDKVRKNQRKTFGTLRDLMRARSVGIIEELPERGLVKYAKPVGVVGAVCPSTNPAATTVNKSMMALKGANAVIIAPSPAGATATRRTCEHMRAGLKQIGLPEDLVQCLPDPVTKEMTQALLEQSDLAVVTGSQDNVRRAYRSGTPAIGVGAGNVPVIIDASADLDQAARLICQSKTFDNATSCSAENALVIVDSVYDRAIEALRKAGGFMAGAGEKKQIQDVLWAGGKLNRQVIAKNADVFARVTGLPKAAEACKFFMVEENGVGKAYPFSGEKLSLALAVYRAKDIDDAIDRVQEILNYQGMGHSCGIHTRDLSVPRRIAERLDVVRVLVNQAHCIGNGGSFDNGLGFTLTMGCGTWAKNSISENLSYKHFINITHLSTVIAEDLPSEEALFGAHWSRYGR